MKKGIIFFILSLTGFNSFSQPYLGTWTSYLPYNKATKLAVAEEKVYCSTNGGLFYFNLLDNSINKLSKENGLSDSDISTLQYSEATGSLLIAYKNANIDIIKGNQIFNLPDIMRKQILGDKSIYSIYIHNDQAYLACGFGIVILNLNEMEFGDTYYIGQDAAAVKVNSVTVADQLIFAGTDEGLYYADINNPNLIDFNNWTKDTRFSSGNDIVHSITASSDIVYVSSRMNGSMDDSILYLESGTWKTYPYLQSRSVPYVEAIDDNLLICSEFNIDIFDPSGINLKHAFTGRPVMAMQDSNEGIWIADIINGLVYYPGGGYPEPIVPEGPAGISVFDMTYSNGKLLCVAGGATTSWNNLYMPAETYIYESKKWENWKNDSIKDLIKAEIDPLNPAHYFAASWGYGLVEFLDGEMINLYREDNSSIQSIFPGQPFMRLGGLSFDRSGNLWVTNTGVSSPVSVLTAGGSWFSLSLEGKIGNINLGDILVTQDNHKWIILKGGRGLFVFNENKTYDNEEDDEALRLSVVDKNGDVITNEVYSLAEDRDGNIWVGTNQGPLIYYSPYRVFDDDNFYAQHIVISRNDGTGNGDPLLGTESITCIAVDGANRKWLGTKDGGVFLVSEDGLEQIHEFNTLNSPLLSNNIIDIAIADETGEVFIATENGIISFIGNATEPDIAFNDVYVFPNPVREDYLGDIVISGLIEDTYVKITDLNGNLVFETKSLGGQAIWDGKNYAGDRVSTGIYLVFCSNSDGTQTIVTKLLFIR